MHIKGLLQKLPVCVTVGVSDRGDEFPKLSLGCFSFCRPNSKAQFTLSVPTNILFAFVGLRMSVTVSVLFKMETNIHALCIVSDKRTILHIRSTSDQMKNML